MLGLPLMVTQSDYEKYLTDFAKFITWTHTHTHTCSLYEHCCTRKLLESTTVSYYTIMSPNWKFCLNIMNNVYLQIKVRNVFLTGWKF